MKITKFTLDKPDSDGELSSSVTVSIANPSQETVRWLQYNAVFSTKEGFPLQCSNDCTEDCTIEPGEDFEVSPWGRGISAKVVGDSRDNVTLAVSAVLHAREFYKLGEVDVPTGDFGSASIERQITSGTIEGPIKVQLFRHKADDEGQTRVDCRLFVRNKSDFHLARVELKCELLDPDEAVTETSNDQVTVPARSIACIEGGIGWLKKAQFKGAKIRVSLYVFRPVHTCQCTGTSSPSED